MYRELKLSGFLKLVADYARISFLESTEVLLGISSATALSAVIIDPKPEKPTFLIRSEMDQVNRSIFQAPLSSFARNV
jgi:hypothetical protein